MAHLSTCKIEKIESDLKVRVAKETCNWKAERPSISTELVTHWTSAGLTAFSKSGLHVPEK